MTSAVPLLRLLKLSFLMVQAKLKGPERMPLKHLHQQLEIKMAF